MEWNGLTVQNDLVFNQVKCLIPPTGFLGRPSFLRFSFHCDSPSISPHTTSPQSYNEKKRLLIA